MDRAHETEGIDTLVIGGGQSGLAVGYHLQQHGRPFLILDAGDRVGDAWRERWDSLRLFTPSRYNGLPGKPFPAPPHYFPTKDEMADYLADYAREFELPVRTGTRVDRLTRHENGGFLAVSGSRRFRASNVVVAMATYQEPHVPDFADGLDPGIVQIHSADYRNPSQLQDGPVLIVGAGNSGSEIATELSRHHAVRMSGRDTGHLPFRIASTLARYLWIPLVLRVLFFRILTVMTPLGRAIRPKVLTRGGPLIRVMPRDLEAAGVERVPRTAGVEKGIPILEDGRIIEARNVIWCTGFRTGFESWIDLPIHGDHEPRHHRGIADDEPGLYFVGLHFLQALSSNMIQGVGRDAEHVVRTLVDRSPEPRSRPGPAPAPPREPRRDVSTTRPHRAAVA